LNESCAQESSWRAELELSFAAREGRTILSEKSHCGPLQIQKALYPESPRVCHVALLHPPGGIAGGDSLEVGVRLGPQAHVVMTTPGATKWYRCPRDAARQRLRFSLAAGAALEWLPRETILFDGSMVSTDLDVELAAGAQFLGWEIWCFGRRASGERWTAGGLRSSSVIRQAGRPLWSERADLAAGGGFGASPVGLAGYSVSATLVAAGAKIDSALLIACRTMLPRDRDSRAGVTALPNVLLARYLGHSSQEAFHWFASLWRVLRPAQLGLPAVAPRLWAC
jgi:urease accessory protein